MSRHEGVSCDSCNKSNFRGKRYKCLICFDYDLCAKCYDNGTTTTRHTLDHPMQCILTRLDFDLFYGGENIQFDQPQAFVCPYCSKMGLTETQLQDHVTSQHGSSSTEVICPVCAALPGGDPNHVTDDLGGHLSLEHRALRDVQDEPLRRNIRRIFHPARNAVPIRRRGYPQFVSTTSSTSTSSTATFSSARESIDPIAELLSQLSGVRRAAQQQSASATASQLQLLQQQLQFERQQMQQARERLERLPRKQAASTNAAATSSTIKEAPKEEKDQCLLPQVFEDYLTSNVSVQQRSKYSDFTRELFYSLTASRQEAELPEPRVDDKEDALPDSSVSQISPHVSDHEMNGEVTASASSSRDVDSSDSLLLSKTRSNVEGDDSFYENSEGSS